MNNSSPISPKSIKYVKHIFTQHLQNQRTVTWSFQPDVEPSPKRSRYSSLKETKQKAKETKQKAKETEDTSHEPV